MDAMLIGYFPRKPNPDLNIDAAGVEEVCSVSFCSFDVLTGWLEQWKHNEHFLYDCPEEALSLVRDLKDKEQYDLYAFKQYPFMVDKGRVIHKELQPKSVRPLTEDFEFLGYDVVNKMEDSGEFLCSPLSCNGGYEKLAVNQYCLFCTFEEAFSAAKLFSKGNYEPGFYYVVAVYRRNVRK